MRVLRKFRRRAALGSALAVSVLLAGCGGATDNGGGANDGAGGTVRLATVVDVQSFDPGMNPGQGQRVFLDPVYDRLLTTDVDGQIQPGIAQEWELTNDELTLTIETGRSFSDGSALDAEAVKAALEHNVDAGGPASAALADVEGIRVEGEDTVVLDLSAPSPVLPLALTDVAGMIAVPSGDLATEPVGSGPYVLDTAATQTGVSYVYTRNPEFDDAEQQTLDRIEIQVLTDPAARANALLSGQVDLAQIDRTQLTSIEKSDIEFEMGEGNHWLLHFTDRSPGSPLASQEIRQAIGYALDRENLVQTLLMGYGTPMVQTFLDYSPFHVEDLEDTYAYDPDKARDLVQASGIENPSFTLPVFGPFTAIAEAIQSDLKAVGIEANIELIQPGTLDKENRSTNFGAILTPIKEIHPEQLYSVRLAPDAPMNPFGVALPSVDALHEQAIAATDEESQTEAYRAMLVEQNEQAIWQNLYTDQVIIGWTPALKGVELLPTWPMGPSLRGVTKG